MSPARPLPELPETAPTIDGVMARKKQAPSGFGERLLALRKARGLTQVQLAEAIGSSQRAVSYYENHASYPAAGRLGHGKGYVYPHDQPGGITAASYAPEAVRGREYYQPTRYGAEARYADLVERIRAALRGDGPGE